jgi:hypothetical protein
VPANINDGDDTDDNKPTGSLQPNAAMKTIAGNNDTILAGNNSMDYSKQPLQANVFEASETLKSKNLDMKHSSSRDMDLQIKKKIYANLGNTGKDYGTGKNKKLMGVKAMSTMVRKKTLQRQASM